MVISFLRGLELFRGISEPDSRKISSLCSERRFPQGATLFSEGDPSDALYILKEGLVEIISVSEKGKETILHILKPDDIVGAFLLVEEKRPFTAVAIEDVVARALRLPAVDRIWIEGLGGAAKRATVHAARVEFAHVRRLARVVAFGGEAILGRDLLNRAVAILDGPGRSISFPARAT